MLHDGSIAEMKTGEGKTLVSTLAAYLNALTGEGVHGRSSSEFRSFHVVILVFYLCICACIGICCCH